MILVDSSGWIELFTDGPLAPSFEPFLADDVDFEGLPGVPYLTKKTGPKGRAR